MKCSKCGNEMLETDKWCKKCGFTNPYYKENPSTNPYLTVTDSKVPVGNQTKIEPIKKEKKDHLIIFLAVNIVMFFAYLYSFTFIKYLPEQYQSIIGEKTSLLFPSFLISYFYCICFELLLKKADLPWWGMFIPGYNIYLLFQLAFGSGSMFFWVGILGVMSLCSRELLVEGGMELLYTAIVWVTLLAIGLTLLLLPFSLGKRFHQIGILTFLFSFIMIPIMAFSKKIQYQK